MDSKNKYCKHFVYALINKGKVIYVGCTSNVKSRQYKHKKNKVFDYIFVIKEFDNKNDALIAENAIIRFISILGDDNILNGLFENLKIKKQIIDNYHTL